jgi:hypothetical protein
MLGCNHSGGSSMTTYSYISSMSSKSSLTGLLTFITRPAGGGWYQQEQFVDEMPVKSIILEVSFLLRGRNIKQCWMFL